MKLLVPNNTYVKYTYCILGISSFIQGNAFCLGNRPNVLFQGMNHYTKTFTCYV